MLAINYSNESAAPATVSCDLHRILLTMFLTTGSVPALTLLQTMLITGYYQLGMDARSSCIYRRPVHTSHTDMLS